MTRRWLAPAVLLGLLLVAFAFRWDVEGKQTSGAGMVIWERDRWTGRVWSNVRGVSGGQVAAVDRLAGGDQSILNIIFPFPTEQRLLARDGAVSLEQVRKAQQAYALRERQVVTLGWFACTVAAAAWLILSLRSRPDRLETAREGV